MRNLHFSFFPSSLPPISSPAPFSHLMLTASVLLITSWRRSVSFSARKRVGLLAVVRGWTMFLPRTYCGPSPAGELAKDPLPVFLYASKRCSSRSDHRLCLLVLKRPWSASLESPLSLLKSGSPSPLPSTSRQREQVLIRHSSQQMPRGQVGTQSLSCCLSTCRRKLIDSALYHGPARAYSGQSPVWELAEDLVPKLALFFICQFKNDQPLYGTAFRILSNSAPGWSLHSGEGGQ